MKKIFFRLCKSTKYFFIVLNLIPFKLCSLHNLHIWKENCVGLYLEVFAKRIYLYNKRLNTKLQALKNGLFGHLSYSKNHFDAFETSSAKTLFLFDTLLAALHFKKFQIRWYEAIHWPVEPFIWSDRRHAYEPTTTTHRDRHFRSLASSLLHAIK